MRQPLERTHNHIIDWRKSMNTTQIQHTTICFVDIAGYTKLMQENPEKASHYATMISLRVNEVLRIYDGRIIKKLGDGVMLEFEDQENAVKACSSLMLRWKVDDEEHNLHIGISSGKVTRTQDGDIEGPPAVLASRLCSVANAGVVLVSKEIESSLSSDSMFTFTTSGDVELKNIGQYPLIRIEITVENTEIINIGKELLSKFTEARSAVLPNLTNYGAWDDKERKADQQIDADDTAWNFFKETAKKYNMLCLSEKDNPSETTDIHKYKYFLLMDPIDGSVNAVHNLPFGANFAFGRIKHSNFLIRDIEAVLVMDYLSQKKFIWYIGKQPMIVPPYVDGKPTKPLDNPCNPVVFETPDADSYSKEGSNGPTRQRNLTRVMRQTFKKPVQRRAIDCSGLRPLEIADFHLIGYGDIRGATRPWDTIPSIRFLMEVPEIILMDMNADYYLGNAWIIRTQNHRLESNKSLGDTIIVLHAHDESTFRELAKKDLSQKWSDVHKSKG
jgi:class 3 adenylate cyclase